MTIVLQKIHAASVGLDSLIRSLAKSHPARVAGTAVFLASDPAIAPAALLHNLKHNRVLHERNFIVHVSFATTPRVPDDERLTIEYLDDDFTRILLVYGYMEEPSITRGLGLARKAGVKFDIMSTSFFLSRRSLRPSDEGGMPLWQDKLFIALSRSGANATNFYRLPSNRVVELGQQVVL
jgi:KUP system potassium uptake protein